VTTATLTLALHDLRQQRPAPERGRSAQPAAQADELPIVLGVEMVCDRIDMAFAASREEQAEPNRHADESGRQQYGLRDFALQDEARAGPVPAPPPPNR